MGVDIAHKHVKSHIKRDTNSQDPYMRLLVKLYTFLARRTGAKFNKIILHRLCMSKNFLPTISLSKIKVFSKNKRDHTVAVVGTVLNDERLINVPKNLKICALRFSETARARITAAGGKCMTFDQLALSHPTGSRVLLLRGALKARKAYKYFGTVPGAKGSHTRARISREGKLGRNFESARNKRGRS